MLYLNTIKDYDKCNYLLCFIVYFVYLYNYRTLFACLRFFIYFDYLSIYRTLFALIQFSTYTFSSVFRITSYLQAWLSNYLFLFFFYNLTTNKSTILISGIHFAFGLYRLTIFLKKSISSSLLSLISLSLLLKACLVIGFFKSLFMYPMSYAFNWKTWLCSLNYGNFFLFWGFKLSSSSS